MNQENNAKRQRLQADHTIALAARSLPAGVAYNQNGGAIVIFLIQFYLYY